jgi:peptide/nickel transport system substrate-binding protein
MPVGELITEHLKSVGIKATLKRIDPQLYGQRWSANEIQVGLLWCHGPGEVNRYTSGAIRAPEWTRWYNTEGKEGEEPPEWIKKAYEIDVKRWQSVTGSEEYIRLWKEGIIWHKQYLPLIPVVEKVKQPLIVSARMKNIPRSGFAIAANFSAEQFFYEK